MEQLGGLFGSLSGWTKDTNRNDVLDTNRAIARKDQVKARTSNFLLLNSVLAVNAVQTQCRGALWTGRTGPSSGILQTALLQGRGKVASVGRPP
jgi:hypothetical protein